MTDRVVDIASHPTRICVKDGRLSIEQAGRAPVYLALSEVSVLLLSHPQITVTQPVLAALSEAGAAVIACDCRYLPIGMMLPLSAHSIQGERMALQASASLPTRKRIWAQIVCAKILAQARALRTLRGVDAGLPRLAKKVRSGDPENLEAQAASRYWKVIFGRPEFRRTPDGTDENRFLNYGYAVLRGMAARSVCAAGLHPSLGVHHHNRYDAYRLADDLMEPFRPAVDLAVADLASFLGPHAELSPAAKARLVGGLTGRHLVNGEWRTLGELVQKAAFSLSAVLTCRRRDLEIGVP